MIQVEVRETELPVMLLLTEDERAAILRVFYVVKDNFWLDGAEASILERLLAIPDPRPSPTPHLMATAT